MQRLSRVRSAIRTAACLAAAGSIAISSSCLSAAALQSFERTYSVDQLALANHDFLKAEGAFKSPLRLTPDLPGLLRALAQAQAGAGQTAALATIARVIAVGFGAELSNDPGFMSLRGEAKYDALRTGAFRQSQPMVTAEVAFTLPERHFIPEGMAWDLRNGRFYVSSTYLRKVGVRDQPGRLRDFTRPADHGIWQALGLRIDSGRRWLLVCSGSDDPRMLGFRRDDLGKPGVLIHDLDSGALLARHVLGEPGIHLFNDLVEGPHGKVYITDSDANMVYAQDLVSGNYTRMTPPNIFIYPNGIAITPDGATLYVAEVTGIDLLDIASSANRRLPHPGNVITVGIDGLYFHRSYLIATQKDV